MFFILKSHFYPPPELPLCQIYVILLHFQKSVPPTEGTRKEKKLKTEDEIVAARIIGQMKPSSGRFSLYYFFVIVCNCLFTSIYR